MVTLIFKCDTCGKSFKVKRSTALNKKLLWNNLCEIKDNEVKAHFDKHHQGDNYIVIFPNPIDEKGMQKNWKFMRNLV